MEPAALLQRHVRLSMHAGRHWDFYYGYSCCFGSPHQGLGTASSICPNIGSVDLPASSDRSSTHEPSLVIPGPFDNDTDNLIWAAEIEAGTKISYDTLADIDALEPDPATIQQAFKHPRLKPFWKLETNSEVDGLMEKGGLKVLSRSDLTADELTRVYCSRFQHCRFRAGLHSGGLVLAA